MRRSPTFTPLRVGAELGDAADDLVAHGERQHDAAILQRHLLAAAEVVVALPDVQVGVADAAMRHLDQHLGAFRLRRRQFELLQRLAILDHGPGAHDSVSRSLRICAQWDMRQARRQGDRAPAALLQRLDGLRIRQDDRFGGVAEPVALCHIPIPVDFGADAGDRLVVDRQREKPQRFELAYCRTAPVSWALSPGWE